MNLSERKLSEAEAWWKIECANNPSESNGRMAAIFAWLVDASPEEREEWLEKTGSFEAEMAKAVLQEIADDAPQGAVEVLSEMSR
jgi:hypothetical protein